MPSNKGRQQYRQQPVQPQSNVGSTPNPSGPLPDVESKETPDKPVTNPENMENKDQPTPDPVSPTTPPISTSENSSGSNEPVKPAEPVVPVLPRYPRYQDTDSDFYYDLAGHRCIRPGAPVTVRAINLNNRMVVQEDVLREVPTRGAPRRPTYVQLFSKGSEISPSELRNHDAEVVRG